MPKTATRLVRWTALLCASVLFTAADVGTAEAKRARSRNVSLELTYNVTPNASWEPGLSVFLYADARRNPAINDEDIFASQQFPGVYPRTAGQTFPFTLPNVRVGETILVQGYMCAEGTTDCYPSDSDNPPSCAVEVHILCGFRPSCEPVFTWTGGEGEGGVLCHAECL